ncbi:hypothetical protein OUZ56_026193 [Daphnia magna]|uniref:Uncharacterized protein n=1 Tax=Daphnia magna TaxID=35525 RepID=A0ABQ9ZL13_9CRUS|nr:hypothetical protein OUZ56_026193 [Daphnia magna]
MKYEDQSNLKYLPKEKESKRRWPGSSLVDLLGSATLIVAPKRRVPVVLTSLDRCPPVANRSSKCRVPEVQVSENLESFGQLAQKSLSPSHTRIELANVRSCQFDEISYILFE